MEAIILPGTATRTGVAEKEKGQHTSTGTVTNAADMDTKEQVAGQAKEKEKVRAKDMKKGKPTWSCEQAEDSDEWQEQGEEWNGGSEEVSGTLEDVCEVRTEDDHFGMITIDSGAKV